MITPTAIDRVVRTRGCSRTCCTACPKPVFCFKHVLFACRKEVSEYVTAIEKLQVKDITDAVSKLLKSPPSLAALGDIANIPRYAEIERRFK